MWFSCLFLWLAFLLSCCLLLVCSLPPPLRTVALKIVHILQDSHTCFWLQRVHRGLSLWKLYATVTVEIKYAGGKKIQLSHIVHLWKKPDTITVGDVKIHTCYLTFLWINNGFFIHWEADKWKQCTHLHNKKRSKSVSRKRVLII